MKIGKLRLSSGFLLLLSWLLYRDSSGVIWMGMLACLIHELGHLAMLHVFKSSIKEITITAFGAKINFKDQISYMEEIIAAAAGPVVNLAAAFLSSRLFICPQFAGINLALAVFNLLPVGPLDGARILYCLAAQFGDEDLAYRVAKCVTFSFTVFFGLIGSLIALFGGNLTLLLMCIWLLLGAPQEIPANFD